MLDDLNELRTFERILNLGSLSAAARDLGVSVAVASKRLANLERRTGVRLIQRTTRSLSATEQGLALLGHAERILEERDAAEARLSSCAHEVRGTLRISSPVSLGQRHVAPAAAELARLHPQLEIELTLDDRLIDIVEERIDVAVRIGQPRDSSAIIRKLAENRRILAASPEYLERKGCPYAIDDLAGHEFLRYGDASLPWRLEAAGGKTAEIAALGRLRADSGETVHIWALDGHGIMFKSHVDIAADLSTGRLVRVLPDWSSAPTPIYALYSSPRFLPKKTRAFLDLMAGRLQAVDCQNAGT